MKEFDEKWLEREREREREMRRKSKVDGSRINLYNILDIIKIIWISIVRSKELDEKWLERERERERKSKVDGSRINLYILDNIKIIKKIIYIYYIYIYKLL